MTFGEHQAWLARPDLDAVEFAIEGLTDWAGGDIGAPLRGPSTLEASGEVT